MFNHSNLVPNSYSHSKFKILKVVVMFVSNLLASKRYLITGGGSGLGKMMARKICALGGSVIVCGRRKTFLIETVDELNGEFGLCATWHSLDIRDPEAVNIAVDVIWKEGPLDGLINNAAGNFLARTETISHRALDAVLNIVAHGSAYMTLACGKKWIANDLPGNVLSIVTTYAWTGSAYVVPSAMGKAAVLAMTRSLAVEWGPKRIRLNAIAPGPFPTKGAWERLVPSKKLEDVWEQRNPLGRTGKHEELMNLVAYLLSDQSSYINGDTITIDGGEWLAGAGQFNFASILSNDEWDEISSAKNK
jgi:NAD(P)-dependent dehydrogenase (short-subunit alcohol dehydrogenase family)